MLRGMFISMLHAKVCEKDGYETGWALLFYSFLL